MDWEATLEFVLDVVEYDRKRTFGQCKREWE